MGNWRTVQIEGTCAATDIAALRQYLAAGCEDPRWGPLHCGGACGLPNWADEEINVCGNLGERGFTPEDLRDELLKLCGVAPSLAVDVHCGGDYEDTKCVATVHLERGRSVVLDPQIEAVGQPSPEQIEQQVMAMLQKTRTD